MQGCRLIGSSFVALAAGLLLTAGSGCGSNTLETGYQYTPLGSTSAQRRGYYAGPFSPEARNALMSEQREGGGVDRRPGR